MRKKQRMLVHSKRGSKLGPSMVASLCVVSFLSLLLLIIINSFGY